ncbi:MAG: MFS transporter [Hyphomonadaceae bacterium]|nr:MFS transporter [Hyphomonadaceae bacterium]
MLKAILNEPTARLTLVMSSLYAALGVTLPYLPRWLEDERALSGPEIGAIASAAPIARIIIGPMLATWADGFRDRRAPVVVLCLLGLVFYGLMFSAHGFWALFAFCFLAMTFSQAAAPLVEGATLRASAMGRLPFGAARGIASATFILANVVGGALIASFGVRVAPFWVLASLAAAALAGWLVVKPEPAPDRAAALGFRGRLKVGVSLLKAPVFLRVLAASGLIQAAHGFYYGFSVLVWGDQGISATTIGLLWGFAVAVEVVFLASLPIIERRLSPEALLIIGGAGALVRWSLMAFAPTGFALWPLQALHALSFAAAHVGALRLVMRSAPEEVSGLAQTFYASLASGALLGLATLASGYLYNLFGAGGYAAMAVMAGAGLAIAAPLGSVGLARR